MSAVAHNQKLPPAGHDIELESAKLEEYCCDLCAKTCTGEPASRGLFLWYRDDEVRVEEPPLCGTCSDRVYLQALRSFSIEAQDEE